MDALYSGRSSIWRFALCLVLAYMVYADETTPECKAVWKVFGSKCLEQMDFVKDKNCGQLNPKSNLTRCFERFAYSSEDCKEDLLQKSFKHTIAVYSLMDKLYCDTNIHTEISQSKTCSWNQATEYVYRFAHIYQPYYSEIGCKKLIMESRKVCGKIDSFLDQLIKASSCNNVNVPTDGISDEDYMRCALVPLQNCLDNFDDDTFSVCDNGVKRLQECLSTAGNFLCPLYPIESMKNEIEQRYIKAVAFACKNDVIREIIGNRECWKRSFDSNVMGPVLTQKMLTGEGCRIIRRLEDIQKDDSSASACDRAIKQLSDSLSTDFPCPPATNSGNCGSFITFKASLIMLFALFLLMQIVH